MVETASVQWVRSYTLELAFFQITETEQQRLAQVVTELTEGESTSG
jgi:hypothetical protein